MNLYDYQQAALNDIRRAYREKCRAPLLVSPTGSGKTVMFSAICKGIEERGKRAWILCHRQELVDQISETLNEFGVVHGIIQSGTIPRPSARVQVASVFSLVRHLAQTAAPDLIVIDEAHHCILRSTWGKILSAFPQALLLGVTATPARLSGEGLGDTFDRLILGPSVAELIERGRLSPVRVFAPPTIDVSQVGSKMGEFIKSQLSAAVDKPKITGDAIAHYQAITPGARAAVFCCSLEHAAHMAKAARDAGITAITIDGHTDKSVRRAIIRDFSNGLIQWLVSVDLISEGFDCPGIDVGISLRPTQSLGLWLQQCGRILRTAPGKSCATILDHAGNSLRHGLPTEDRDWSLSGKVQKSGSGERAVSVRVCPSCFSAQRSGGSVCKHCGAAFPVEPRTVSRQKGQLQEITQEEIDARRERQRQGQAKSLENLIAIGRTRGYKDPEGWAAHAMGGRKWKRKEKS